MSAEMRSAEPLTPGEATLTDVIDHVRELEEKVESQADRIDSLEAENEELREKVDEQPDVEYRGDEVLDDLWIGNNPVGLILNQAEDRGKNLNKVVLGTRTPDSSDIEAAAEKGALVDRANGDVGSTSAALPEEVRENLLPAHEMWMDIRTGRENRLPGQSKRRAARLFGRFLKRAAGKPSPVDASGQTYSLTSTDARDALARAGDMSESGRSMTTKRAMQDVQRLTKTDDCDCNTVEECTHGLIHFDKENGTNRLYVSKKHFNTAMQNVEAAIEGGLKDESEDDTGDVDGEMAKLESASRDADSE